MNKFTIKGKEKTVFMIMMGIGLLSVVLTFMTDSLPGKARFWSNFLHEALFFTGIAAMALFYMSTALVGYGGYMSVFKRVLEAMSLQLKLGIAFFLIIVIGLFMKWHHLYLWADENFVANDKVLTGKSGFLNPVMYTIFTILALGSWYFLASRIRRASVQEDEHGKFGDYTFTKKMQTYGALSLVTIGYFSAVGIWQWLMSLDPHWYSTLFAWYTASSWFVAMLSLLTLIILYLKGQGYMPYFTKEHMHDIGKFIFGISVFWSYLWFSQYMLIWYGNVGEETVYFKVRVDHYPVLFYGNLIMNFVLPFLLLLPNTTKRMRGTMVFIAVLLLIGHWIDIFLMVKPGVLHTVQELSGAHEAVGEHGHEASSFVSGFTLPGFLEIGTFIGFLGLFLYTTFIDLTKACLLPVNDAYIEESIHHHVV